MKNINVLCYNSKDELILLYTSKDIQQNEIVAIEGDKYKVTNVEKGVVTYSNKNMKIVNLQEWKK